MSRQTLFLAPSMSEALFTGVVAALERVGSAPSAPLFKDMECMRFTRPSQWTDWALDHEAAAVELLRKRSDIDELDLVGYSGGGAASLAYAVAHPETIASLTLIEPPWIGNDLWSEEEVAFREAYDELGETPDEGAWAAIAHVLNGPETPVPPAPAVEPSALREALLGVWRGYRAAPLDRTLLRQIEAPVYLPFATDSSPRMRAQAELLASEFPDARMEVVDGANHFDLTFAGAEQLANGIARLWREAA